MPIYEYCCRKCNKIYESLQEINSPATMECECGGLAKKIVSSFSVRVITGKENDSPNESTRTKWKKQDELLKQLYVLPDKK